MKVDTNVKDYLEAEEKACDEYAERLEKQGESHPDGRTKAMIMSLALESFREGFRCAATQLHIE